MDPDTAEPLDTLAPLAKRAIEELGSRCTTVSDVVMSRDPVVFSAISEGLARVNNAAVSNAQKVCFRTLTELRKHITKYRSTLYI